MFKFKKLDFLTDNEIDLRIKKKAKAVKIKGYLPAYIYHITMHGDKEPIGQIDIRIGRNANTYYGGNIGYRVYEGYRGHGYAEKACRIIAQVARAHGMETLLITCNPDNTPSRRTCEKLGAVLSGIVDLPPYNEMYKMGERQKCIYEWNYIL